MTPCRRAHLHEHQRILGDGADAVGRGGWSHTQYEIGLCLASHFLRAVGTTRLTADSESEREHECVQQWPCHTNFSYGAGTVVIMIFSPRSKTEGSIGARTTITLLGSMLRGFV